MRYQSKGTPAMESGQGLVEYALALILVGVAVIVGLSFFGQTIREQYCTIVTSIDPDIDAPLCDEEAASDPGGDSDPEDDPDEEEEEEGDISVSCNVQTSPFRMSASVNDNAGENDITRVEFYLDGGIYNVENVRLYCLEGGDSSCLPYDGPKGTHTIRAVAYDKDGHSGSCSTTVNIP